MKSSQQSKIIKKQSIRNLQSHNINIMNVIACTISMKSNFRSTSLKYKRESKSTYFIPYWSERIVEI